MVWWRTKSVTESIKVMIRHGSVAGHWGTGVTEVKTSVSRFSLQSLSPPAPLSYVIRIISGVGDRIGLFYF